MFLAPTPFWIALLCGQHWSPRPQSRTHGPCLLRQTQVPRAFLSHNIDCSLGTRAGLSPCDHGALCLFLHFPSGVPGSQPPQTFLAQGGKYKWRINFLCQVAKGAVFSPGPVESDTVLLGKAGWALGGAWTLPTQALPQSPICLIPDSGFPSQHPVLGDSGQPI